MNKRRKKKRDIAFIIMYSVIGIFAGFIIIGMLFSQIQPGSKAIHQPEKPGSAADFQSESISENFDYDKKSYYKISSKIDVDISDSIGKFYIEYGDENKYCIKISVLNENGNIIHKTDYIYPKEEIQEILFNINTEKEGEFKVTALIEAYDTENFELLGESEENIILNVKK